MTQLVGILNLTSDSFSDGRKYNTPKAALKQVETIISEGAEVIDIGAESTRPGAKLITAKEEWKRLSKILPEILKQFKDKAKFSLDTRHHETVEKAIDLGIDWVNDVSGFEDTKILELCKKSDVKLVIMHNMGIPADPKKTIPAGSPPEKQVFEWCMKKLAQLNMHGITTNRVIFDPGIGFGKSPKQSFELIKSIDYFKNLGLPIMVGHSRKSFLTMFTDKEAAGRDAETALVSGYLSTKNIDYLRVHNIAVNAAALKIYAALK